MDNRIFNVNGESEAMLLNTLRLVFAQCDGTTCVGYFESKEKGLVLCRYASDGYAVNKLPPMNADQIFHFVLAWMKTEYAQKVIDFTNKESKEKDANWDKDIDHDGSNELGWRVYCESWGHVGDYHGAICAIKPVHLWYGK